MSIQSDDHVAAANPVTMHETRGLKLAATLAAAVLLTGCQTQLTPPAYRTSRDALFYLHQAPDASVSVSPFSGRRLNALWLDQCRGLRGNRAGFLAGDFSYVRNAFVQELRLARLYTESGGAVTLTGNLDRVRLNRVAPFDGRWSIQLRLSSSNGRSITVREDYRFDFDGLLGPAGCRSAVRALEPAVRGLIDKTVTHPEFRSLLA